MVLGQGLPADVLGRAVLVALGVSCHFLLFVLPILLRSKLPGKEFGVGLLFALGAYACLGATPATLPLLGSIALVVAFNCLVIAARDADSDRTNDPGGASRWWRSLQRDLWWLGATLTVAAVLAALLCPETAFYLAFAAAFALLTLLHAFARHLSGDAVRALADFALLTPWLTMSVVAFLAQGFVETNPPHVRLTSVETRPLARPIRSPDDETNVRNTPGDDDVRLDDLRAGGLWCERYGDVA